MKYSPAQLKKSLVAVLGFVLTVFATILGISPGLLPVEWLPWVHVAIAVGTIYGVYKVRNATVRPHANVRGDYL